MVSRYALMNGKSI